MYPGNNFDKKSISLFDLIFPEILCEVPQTTIDEWKNVVALRLGTTAFKIEEVTRERNGETPSGFIGDHIRAKVRVRKDDDSEETLRFFAKVTFNEVGFRGKYGRPFFRREVTFYNYVMKSLIGGGCKNILPKCFLAERSVIVMDDLREDGFKCLNTNSGLDFGQSEMIIKSLSRFHAATIISEENNQLKSTELAELLKDNLMHGAVVDGVNYDWLLPAYDTLKKIVRQLPKYVDDPVLCQTICDKMEYMGCIADNFLSSSQEFRNVVCHCDLWGNNILVRYNEDNTPESVRFVDFQVVRYLPPACDIILFLYLSLRRSEREKYLSDLLDVYYETFVQELSLNGISNAVFPRDEFDRSCRIFRDMGRMVAAASYQHIYMNPEFIHGHIRSDEVFQYFIFVDRWPQVKKCLEEDQFYRDVVYEILYELIECTILPSSVNGE